MTLDMVTATRIIGPMVSGVAPQILKGIQSKLNPTELEKALQAGIEAAQGQEEKLPPPQQMFSRVSPDLVGKFLEKLFRRGEKELQRPLKGEGMPQVNLLVEIFKQVAAENPYIQPPEDRIEPWMRAFVSTYFEKTKTFQEYLCALEIDYQRDSEGNFNIVLDCIREHLHDPHWREVLLLLIAQQKPKNAAKAIRAILNRGSEYEQWLHRDLLFAGSCLAEDPKNLKVEDNGLSQDILQKLVELEVSYYRKVGNKVRARVLETLCSLGGTNFETEALHLLKEKAEDIDERRWQEYQVALEEKDAVIEALVQRLHDEDSLVRGNAASALGNLGIRDKKVVSALVQRLHDEDSLVRENAASALGELGTRDKKVVSALVQRLDDEESSVRWKAADALGKLGARDEQVVSALVQRLDDEDFLVRGRVADALGKLGHYQPDVLSAVEQWIEQHQDSEYVGGGVDALWNLVADRP